MKKAVSLVLGVLTSIGGFVEVGSISTAAQAGAEFGFELLWAVPLAALILAVLAEMSGRLAAVGKRSVAAAVRERFGFHFYLVPFFTLAFVVAAWQLQPSGDQLLEGLVPSLPQDNLVRYAFLAVAIVGATISPYLLNFFSSGAIEEEWAEKDLWINRTTSFFGMGFGSVVSMGVLVTAALVLGPEQIQVESYEQAALMFLPVMGSWAVLMFAVALGIGCLGAAVELVLNSGYVCAQAFGWPWSANQRRRDVARFSTTFTGFALLAVALALTGFDPLKITMISVALTVVVMPLVVLPFLVLMNDQAFLKKNTSGPVGNVILAVLTILGAVLAAIVIPLEILGG